MHPGRPSRSPHTEMATASRRPCWEVSRSTHSNRDRPGPVQWAGSTQGGGCPPHMRCSHTPLRRFFAAIARRRCSRAQRPAGDSVCLVPVLCLLSLFGVCIVGLWRGGSVDSGCAPRSNSINRRRGSKSSNDHPSTKSRRRRIIHTREKRGGCCRRLVWGVLAYLP